MESIKVLEGQELDEEKTKAVKMLFSEYKQMKLGLKEIEQKYAQQGIEVSLKRKSWAADISDINLPFDIISSLMTLVEERYKD